MKKDKEKIPVSLSIVKSRNAYTDINQKRVFALGMIAMNQERQRLYDSLENGRAEADELTTDAERKEHFRNFLPDVNDVNRLASFSVEYLMAFTGLKKVSLYKTIGRAARVMHTKGIQFESDSGKEKKTGGFAPIYDGEFSTVDGLQFYVAERAVREIMNHSHGFNEIDIKLFVELESIHAVKLLEIISGYKSNPIFDMKLDTLRFRFNVDCKRYESKEQIERYAATGKYRTDGAEIGDKILDHDGNSTKIYPVLRDFRRRVLNPAFEEIIEKSNGMWTATDKDGLGYQLMKTGKKFTHIKFCLKYNPDAVSVLPLVETPNDSEDKEDKTPVSREEAAKEFGALLFAQLKKKDTAKQFGIPSPAVSGDFEVSEEAKALIERKKAERQARLEKAKQQFSVDKFTHHSLDYWFITHAEDPDSLEPISLVISEVEVTRSIREDGESVFVYEFCGDDWIIEPNSAPRVLID